MRRLKAFASVRRWPAVCVWNCSLNGKLNWNEIQVSKVSHIQMRKYTLISLLIWTLLTHALPLSRPQFDYLLDCSLCMWLYMHINIKSSHLIHIKFILVCYRSSHPQTADRLMQNAYTNDRKNRHFCLRWKSLIDCLHATSRSRDASEQLEMKFTRYWVEHAALREN